MRKISFKLSSIFKYNIFIRFPKSISKNIIRIFFFFWLNCISLGMNNLFNINCSFWNKCYFFKNCNNIMYSFTYKLDYVNNFSLIELKINIFTKFCVSFLILLLLLLIISYDYVKRLKSRNWKILISFYIILKFLKFQL